MAIAHVATSNSENQTGSYTEAHTVSGSNTILLVFTWNTRQTGSGADVVTGVTYNSVAMTKIGSSVTIETNDTFLAAWYLINPSSGTNNISVTCGAGDFLAGSASVSYSGAKQSSQPDATANATGSGTSAASSVTTVADNSWVVMGVGGTGAGGSASDGGNWTARVGLTKAGVGDLNAAKTPAGGVTQTATLSASQAWGVIQVSIAPSVAAGPTNLKTWNTNVAANIKTINTNPIANVKSLDTNT